MTSRQYALVQETFDELRPLPRAFGIALYEHLFFIDPSLRTLFRGSFENQAAMFATALTMAVAGLGEDGYIPPSVRELGARHAGYGLPEASYAAFGEALLWTLKARLGDRFTPEAEAAWAAAYADLSAVLKQAVADARAAKERAATEIGVRP